MKTYNQKLAGRIFCALIALDAVLFTLFLLIPSSGTTLAWWIINAPGYEPGIVVGRFLSHSGVAFTQNSLMIGIGIFSALVWSAFSGYVFRRKVVA
jgi:hypothetical protein